MTINKSQGQTLESVGLYLFYKFHAHRFSCIKSRNKDAQALSGRVKWNKNW